MKNKNVKFALKALTLTLLTASTGWSMETLLCGKVESINSQYGQIETRGKGNFILKANCKMDKKETYQDPIVEIDTFATDPAAGNAKLSDASRRGKLTMYKQKMVDDAAKAHLENPRAQAPYVCMVADVTANPCVSQAGSKTKVEASITAVNRISGTPEIFSKWISDFKKTQSVKNFKKIYKGAIDEIDETEL